MHKNNDLQENSKARKLESASHRVKKGIQKEKKKNKKTKNKQLLTNYLLTPQPIIDHLHLTKPRYTRHNTLFYIGARAPERVQKHQTQVTSETVPDSQYHIGNPMPVALECRTGNTEVLLNLGEQSGSRYDY